MAAMAWPRFTRQCSTRSLPCTPSVIRTAIRPWQRRKRISKDCSSTIRKISGFSLAFRQFGTPPLISSHWPKNNPHPDASGWAFEYNNVYYPDTDDTAMVLMALRLVHPKDKNSYEDLFQRALACQLSFQCRDGGWAAFDKDVIDGWLENMPFANNNAILDPTCSNLTARTLKLSVTSTSTAKMLA